VICKLIIVEFLCLIVQFNIWYDFWELTRLKPMIIAFLIGIFPFDEVVDVAFDVFGVNDSFNTGIRLVFLHIILIRAIIII
jgi:hypothetical protein